MFPSAACKISVPFEKCFFQIDSEQENRVCGKTRSYYETRIAKQDFGSRHYPV